jgi:hypothetical protein
MGFETALVLGEGVTHVLHAARELPLAKENLTVYVSS